MNSNNLGEKLKEARQRKDLKLQQVGSMSRVSTSHIGRIERGERFPSARILRKLAEPLGFSEIQLLKLAGLLGRDDRDEALEQFKKEIKREIAHALVSLYRKIDSL